MKYRLALFDVDSTLIEQEVIDLLAQRTPYGDRVSEITRRAMAGEIDFDSALKERVSLLPGLSIFSRNFLREFRLIISAPTLLRFKTVC